MPYKYAQIKSGTVVALSELSGEVIALNMIALDSAGQHNGRTVKLGDLWDGSNFSDAPEA